MGLISDMFKGKAPTPKTGLDSSERAERERALAAAKTESADTLARELARLDDERSRAHEQQRKRDEAAKEQATATERALDAAIAKDASERIPPLVAAYVADPTRKNAKAIGDEWRELNARCMTAIGLPLAWPHLEVAFHAAKYGAEIRHSDRSIANWSGQLLEAVIAAALVSDTIRLEDALRAFESDFDANTRTTETCPKECARKRERRALALSFATTRHAAKPFEEMRARHDAEDRKATLVRDVADRRETIRRHGVKEIGRTIGQESGGTYNETPITNADILAQREADLAAAG